MSTNVTSVVKHFPKAQDGFQTTLSGTISAAATTIPLNSVAGYSNGDVVVLIVDPTSATAKQVVTGTVDTSGSQLTNAVWTNGTNQTHNNGTTVVDYTDATHMSMVTKGLLVSHAQDGTFASGALLTAPKVATSINDTNGNEIIKTPATASAVNEITVTNAAAGNKPKISATGGDTNVGLDLAGKGTGAVSVGTVNVFGYDYVASGCVWTADAAGSTRLGSMSSGVVVIGGVPLTVAAVTGHTFTASRDTYVDFTNNGDGTAAIAYNEVTNNAASPALTGLRNAIVVTGASSIAAAASINQGQVDRLLPIVSGVPYTYTDSLGNMICNRNRNPSVLAYRKVVSGGSNGTTSYTGVATTPYLAPANTNIQVFGAVSFGDFSTNQASTANLTVVDSATSVATGVGFLTGALNANNARPAATDIYTPAASGLRTLTLSFSLGGSFQMSSWSDAMIIVRAS